MILFHLFRDVLYGWCGGCREAHFSEYKKVEGWGGKRQRKRQRQIQRRWKGEAKSYTKTKTIQVEGWGGKSKRKTERTSCGKNVQTDYMISLYVGNIVKIGQYCYIWTYLSTFWSIIKMNTSQIMEKIMILKATVHLLWRGCRGHIQHGRDSRGMFPLSNRCPSSLSYRHQRVM